MKELIEEADRLRRQIDEAQVHLINARLQKDEEGKKSAISEMETTMCNAMQLLTCLVEHKDNIVDLGEVWHEISVEPEYDDKRLVFECKDGFISYCSTKSKAVKCWGTWERVSLGATVRWAYVDDLLPKGGD